MWSDQRSRTPIHIMRNSSEGVERIHPNTQEDHAWRSIHRHKGVTCPTVSEQTLKTGNSIGHILDETILHKVWTAHCTHLFDKKQRSVQDIINQIQAELKEQITISFNSNRTDVSKQMLTWRHKDILCTLHVNHQLVFKFNINNNSNTLI